MTTADQLLPPNAGVFTRALAAAMTGELPVPLADIMDPAKTPAAWMPFLAAHESVDLWYQDWSDARKRQMIAQALHLAALKGTRAAAAAFLAYVDALIVHKRSFPSRAPVGRIIAGITPINHPDFTARFLVKVALTAPCQAIRVASTAIGRASLRTIDREPIRRAMKALAVSKASDTAYSVSFAHRIPFTLDDGLNLDAGLPLGAYKNRIRL